MVGPTGKGLWRGKEGDSVFTEPFIDHTLQPNRMPGFLEHIQNTGDDRSFVIVSTVVIERYLDALLQGIIPGYDDLADKREFTLSLKLSLLSGLRLIPPHIVQIADLLRKIRNVFAHDLECGKLETLDQSLKAAMANRVRETYGNQDPYSSSAREMFKALTFLALVGLESYRTNLAILREKMDDGSLRLALGKECNQRHTAKIAAVQSQAPSRIVDKDGWRYKYYSQGVVAIEPVDLTNPPATVNLSPADLV